MRERRLVGDALAALGVTLILTVVLLPAVGSARARSAQTVETECLTNLRSLGLAWLIYAEEWDGHSAPAWGKDQRPWCRRLEQYVRDSHVFECPAIKTTSTYEKMGYPIGYGLNDNVGGGIDFYAVLQPDQLIVVGDDADDHTKAKGWYFMMDWDTRLGDNAAPPADRHEGGANMAFADGHAKWFKYEDVGFRDVAKHPDPPGRDYWRPQLPPAAE